MSQCQEILGCGVPPFTAVRTHDITHSDAILRAHRCELEASSLLCSRSGPCSILYSKLCTNGKAARWPPLSPSSSPAATALPGSVCCGHLGPCDRLMSHMRTHATSSRFCFCSKLDCTPLGMLSFDRSNNSPFPSPETAFGLFLQVHLRSSGFIVLFVVQLFLICF
jgi:hypothetical protein